MLTVEKVFILLTYFYTYDIMITLIVEIFYQNTSEYYNKNASEVKF